VIPALAFTDKQEVKAMLGCFPEVPIPPFFLRKSTTRGNDSSGDEVKLPDDGRGLTNKVT
jgi:hypothetical protein